MGNRESILCLSCALIACTRDSGFCFFLIVGLGVMFCCFFLFPFFGGFSFGCECGSECVVKWRASLTLTSVWEKWVCSVLVLGGHVFTVFVICRDLCVFCYKCVCSCCVKFYKSSESFFILCLRRAGVCYVMCSCFCIHKSPLCSSRDELCS